MNRHAIVACATPSWLAPAAVALWSCARHGAPAGADLLLVSVDPSPEDEADLARFNALRGTRIRLLAVDASELAPLQRGRWGLGTLLRLKLDQWLPRHYERVLYVDCDVLALDDIAGIFSVDMDGQMLAAVEDIGSIIKRRTIEHVRRLGLPEGAAYFNAGVLLFDWRRCCTRGYLGEALDLMRSGKDWWLLDQDVLNVASAGHWKRLDLRWNMQQLAADLLGEDIDSLATFRHFVGRNKPWNSHWYPGYQANRKLYAAGLAGTPWSQLLSRDQRPWSFKYPYKRLRWSLALLQRAQIRAALYGPDEPYDLALRLE